MSRKSLLQKNRNRGVGPPLYPGIPKTICPKCGQMTIGCEFNLFEGEEPYFKCQETYEEWIERNPSIKAKLEEMLD